MLSIDADEVVSPDLGAAIRAALSKPQADVYAVDRLSNFCGQWVRHSGWYPDWIPRLFKRGTARFSDDLVHERLVLTNPDATKVARLQGKLMHYSYEDFETVLRKLDNYSTAGRVNATRRETRQPGHCSVARGVGLCSHLPSATRFSRRPRGFHDCRVQCADRVLPVSQAL